MTPERNLKVDFKTNCAIKYKEKNFIIRKYSVHQENIAIINVYCLITEPQNI